MRRAFVPKGCDQQGRHEPTIPPTPAEASTELGFDKDEDQHAGFGAVFWPWASALAIVVTLWVVSGVLA